MRTFETGATRDQDQTKFDPEGFLSPLVIQRYCEYMHENRRQADGNLRDSDNWQKGIPLTAYAKSLWRHFLEFWWWHRKSDSEVTGKLLERALCAILFNAMGYLHELLRRRPYFLSLSCSEGDDAEPKYVSRPGAMVPIACSALVALLLLAPVTHAQPAVNFAPTSPQVNYAASPAFWVQGIDTRLVPPGQWSFGSGVDHHKYAGGGHVAAFDARLWVHADNPTQPGDQLVGADSFCFTESGGSCYGLNAYVGYYYPSPPTGMAHGGEIDTDVRVPAQRKVGLIFADVAHSRAGGASKDAAIWITKQLSASPETDPVGYKHAIDVSPEPGAALWPTTVDILSASGGSVPRGIDLSGMTFTDTAIALPPGYLFKVGTHYIYTSGANALSVCGGQTVPVCINIEMDWVVFRRGGSSPRDIILDWESGQLVRRQ